MNFYIVNDETMQILLVLDHAPSYEKLQEYANEFGCPVYVIHGEHYGMTANPDGMEPPDA